MTLLRTTPGLVGPHSLGPSATEGEIGEVDWILASHIGATRLTYAAWRAETLARPRTGWLTASAMSALRPGQRLTIELAMQAVGGRACPILSPGDTVVVLRVATNRDAITVQVGLDRGHGEAAFLGRDGRGFQLTRRKAARLPMSLTVVGAKARPRPGDRIHAPDEPGYVALAQIAADQTGLAPRALRFVDQAGKVRVCGQHRGQWREFEPSGLSPALDEAFGLAA